jgi:hypothetical protein
LERLTFVFIYVKVLPVLGTNKILKSNKKNEVIMYNDPEIIAMGQVYEVLKDLEGAQVKRILNWLSSRFGSEGEQPLPVASAAAASTPSLEVQPPIPVSAPGAETEMVAEPEPVVEEEIPEETVKPASDNKTVSTKGLGMKRYKSIENLFLAADTDKVSSRILLAAAFLQEKHGYNEMSSYDINSRLKKLGYGVSNITTAINGLLKKKPPLMNQVRKEGSSKQAKRKFVVTEKGLEVAKTLLRSASE